MRTRYLAALMFAGAIAHAQQPPARADSVPMRADYRDLTELLQKIPNVSAPSLDESRGIWLAALPLACLDRLQSRPGRGGGRANAPADTSAGRGGRAGPGAPARDTSPNDSAGRGGRGGPSAAGANNSGAGYFWVPTYSLVHDHDRLRAFWGCNDWHSAVGSTWATVRLLKQFPKTPLGELAREKLNAHLGKANLDGELEFFKAAAAAINPIPSASQQGLFERPYGFAWLLELQTELRTWPDTQGKRWAADVAPLAAWMADSLGGYLANLVEPVRTGTQNNTAQSMTLALDYADVAGDVKLRQSITTAARRLFLADTVCATQSERIAPAPPGGRGGRGGAGGGGRGGRGPGRGANADSAARAAAPPDTTPNDLTATAGGGRGATGAPPAGAGGGAAILSPCLSEAALMGRVLEQRAYVSWLDRFLPPMHSGRFAPLTEAVSIPTAAPTPAQGRGAAPDTSAAAVSAAAAALATERARLAGLSFARAQAMERIARALPATDPRVAAWHRLSAIQADRGFELMRDDSAGGYWLPSQALLYTAVRRP